MAATRVVSDHHDNRHRPSVFATEPLSRFHAATLALLATTGIDRGVLHPSDAVHQNVVVSCEVDLNTPSTLCVSRDKVQMQDGWNNPVNMQVGRMPAVITAQRNLD